MINSPPMELPVLGTDERLRISPSKIIALGLNYREHIAESLTAREREDPESIPEEPVLFPKTPNALVPPGSPIVLPAILSRYDFQEPRTDYEAELAIVIGQPARRLEPGDAMNVILGYTCANDVSQRNIQKGDRSGWFRGKSFDTFLPLGPTIVPKESIDDPQNLDIRGYLNGNLVQEGNTGQMIFSVAEMVSFISWNFSLEPGDIILTGTPAGVGPLAPGDEFTVEIERIGRLSNPVAAADGD